VAADTVASPWLGIPARDYEAHMDEVGQSAALRDIFARAWADVRPRRLLVLGCTTGRDFDAVDRAVTETSVGVDLNREYLDAARRRLERLGGTAVHGDVLQAALPCSAFDLVHAALIFEYVDAAVLFRRIAEWLAPDGVCCAVTQNRAAGVASVSTTATCPSTPPISCAPTRSTPGSSERHSGTSRSHGERASRYRRSGEPAPSDAAIFSSVGDRAHIAA
jgi:SAM-dependent methyltransferase